MPLPGAAIDLEIYESNPTLKDGYPIRPNRVKINGQEVLTPADQGITLTPLAGSEDENLPPVLIATIPVFVRSLKVFLEGDK